MPDADTPTWDLVREWIDQCPHSVRTLVPSDGSRSFLDELEITNQSCLGSVVAKTGGILVDDGWLRILGSGHAQLERTPLAWSRQRLGLEVDQRPVPLLFVADDVIGGQFALNCGWFGNESALGEVYYFAPDSLRWESLKIQYSGLLQLALTDRLDAFYEELRWRGWREEVRGVSSAQMLSIWPPLWTKESKDTEPDRRPVPILEVCQIQDSFVEQLGSEHPL